MKFTSKHKAFAAFGRSTFLFVPFIVGSTLMGCAAEGMGTAEADPEVAQPVDDGTAVIGAGLTGGKTGGASTTELARMQQYLRDHYDPADVVHSFRARAGETVDCVDVYAQPALRKPGMEKHVIELAPRTLAKTDPTHPGAQREALERLTRQPTQDAVLAGDLDDDGNTRRCPDGSIPIRRVTLEELSRFDSLESYFNKYPVPSDVLHPAANLPGEEAPASPDTRTGSTAFHQYAHAYQSITNMGAESYQSLWSPYAEKSSEFSLSQLWLVRGSGSSRETVEAGNQVYKGKYGDSKGRLFIYFTPDNYGSGGCYNLDCGGFVQTSSSVYIGGAWTYYSAIGGSQYDAQIKWYKDGTSGNWWLMVVGTWVGYYPRSKFDSYGLADKAATIDFGGEIIDDTASSRHTYTDMGSGRFASEGWTKAAYQRNIRYFNTSLASSDPTLTASMTDYWCYDIKLYNNSGTSWGDYFYYGGSGYNSECM